MPKLPSIFKDESFNYNISVPKLGEDISSFISNCYAFKPKNLYLTEVKWKYLIRSVLKGDNVLMTGPSGTGKTVSAYALPLVLKRPFFSFNMGSIGDDAKIALIGNTHYEPSTGTFFSESDFIRAITTPYAIILLDELTRASKQAWNILMSVLDKEQRYIRVDDRVNNRILEVAEGVSFIATANIGFQYTATYQMDWALENRFTIVEMDPIPLEEEIKFLSNMFPDVNENVIRIVCKIAHDTRLDISSGTSMLENDISTRMLMQFCDLINDGFSFMEAVDTAIIPFYSSEGGNTSERVYLKEIIQKHYIPMIDSFINSKIKLSATGKSTAKTFDALFEQDEIDNLFAKS